MKRLLTICMVVVMLALCGSVRAATWDVPGDYPTIQDAIDSVSEGDTILVAAGNHAGAFVTKNVVIRGHGGAVIDDGPAHGSGMIMGFRLLEGSTGATISYLTFEVDFPIMNGDGCDDVTVDHCTFISSVQAVSNWNGSGWNISHNVINGLRTRSGGGIGIFIGTWGEDVSANDNLVSHNTITGEIVVPGDECGGYSTPGIGLMSDRRWDRPAGPMCGNRVVKNKISLYITVPEGPDPMECHGIELTDLGLYEDPPGADLEDNQIGFNDVRAVIGIPIALYPAEVVDENTISRNLGVDIPNLGVGLDPATAFAPFAHEGN